MVERLTRHWEIRALDRCNLVISFVLQPIAFYALGEALGPKFGTNGLQMAVWAGVASTVMAWTLSGATNMFLHYKGPRGFDTLDESRNSIWLAIPLLGGGWHNNHHRYPGLARCGLESWQFDPSFYLIKLLQILGIVWDVREPPPSSAEIDKRRQPNLTQTTFPTKAIESQHSD